MTRAETSGVREGSSAGPGPGNSQRRPSGDRNRLGGGSLIQTDGLEGAVLGGGRTRHRTDRRLVAVEAEGARDEDLLGALGQSARRPVRSRVPG